MLKMSEKLSNKTCAKCKSFPGNGYYCPIIGRFCDPNNETACEFFEKPVGRIATNGDVIRHMSNKKLATCIEELAFRFSSRREFKAWLNAPADCVKQNGDHYTQTDLCKADYTESEGK